MFSYFGSHAVHMFSIFYCSCRLHHWNYFSFCCFFIYFTLTILQTKYMLKPPICALTKYVAMTAVLVPLKVTLPGVPASSIPDAKLKCVWTPLGKMILQMPTLLEFRVTLVCQRHEEQKKSRRNICFCMYIVFCTVYQFSQQRGLSVTSYPSY